MGTDANGNRIVLTPGSIVGANVVQALQTGFKQLENANDIDQMVGGLFAGITTHVVSDNRGLTGLTKPTGSLSSYLDQVVSESSAGLRNTVVNAGLGLVAFLQKKEADLRALAYGIVQKAQQTAQKLRDEEKACWTIVTDAVCDSSVTTTGTCTDTDGTTYKIATTSYQFAQGVINSQLATPIQTYTNLASSTENTLKKLGELASQLANTASYSSQLLALQGLDRMVAQGTELHTDQQVKQTRDAFDLLVGQGGGAGTLDILFSDTEKAWEDSTADPALGWCNINNPAVITLWKDRWNQ